MRFLEQGAILFKIVHTFFRINRFLKIFSHVQNEQLNYDISNIVILPLSLLDSGLKHDLEKDLFGI